MKVLDGTPKPYTPSFLMEPGYLTRRFLEIKAQQEAEKRAAENNEQQTQRVEEWRG